MSPKSKKQQHGMFIGAVISMALVAGVIFNQSSCSTTKANTNIGVTTEVADVARSQDEVCYTGDYYDKLAGLETLLSDQYSSQDVKLGLRALIGYQSQTTYVEAFGKNIQGTDIKHPRYKGTKEGSLAELWQESERTKQDVMPAGCYRLFYTDVYGTSLDDYSNAVNREHVWPQSLSGGLFGTSGAGADAHHIRPCNKQLNGARSNKKYGDLEEEDIEYTYFTSTNQAKSFNLLHDYYTEDYVSNSYGGKVSAYSNDYVFEPRDDYKGDIARIIAYMALHYESLEGIVDNVMVDGYETIKEWNDIDPVDKYEENRNEVVFKYQGNRNPFIDEPDLIDKIWG